MCRWASAHPGAAGSIVSNCRRVHRAGRWLEFPAVPEVRETRGLAYSVYPRAFADSGAPVYAACLPGTLRRRMRVTAMCWKAWHATVLRRECGIAKGSLRGGLR